MSFYNKYFSIKYPFEKLDIVAVPDFAPGAMENTGAIFYRERLLLVDEPKVSVDAKRSVASVLAHEIAHHWFGDLVTMKWWDDIWLNEGFATWMENKPVRDLRPTWGADLVEASDTQRALNLDALQATRPIRVKADTPDEISELFDAITYEKGAAVLRMVENMVGPDVFRTGVNNYLKKYAYGNASAEDFWAEIAAASGTPVARIMGSFVDQSGSPLINIRSECKGDRLSVTATQERFSFDATSSSGGAREWQVPVCMKWPGPNGQLEQSCRVFSKPVDTWQAGACSGWVFANAGGMGAYRTAYQPDMLRRIAQVADTSLLPVERISLLGDEWALVRHGGHTVADYLSLAERTGPRSRRTRSQDGDGKARRDFRVLRQSGCPSHVRSVDQAVAAALGSGTWMESAGERARRSAGTSCEHLVHPGLGRPGCSSDREGSRDD